MPAVPKHRRPIIDAAVTLFRRQGYAGTGLNDIVDLSGAPKGSLYHYFPAGKASIAVASVEEAGQRVATTLGELAVTARSTGDLLKAHARLLASWMRKSGYRDGCPITTVLLELAPEDRAVAEAGRRAYAARLAVITAQLIADGVPAALRFRASGRSDPVTGGAERRPAGGGGSGTCRIARGRALAPPAESQVRNPTFADLKNVLHEDHGQQSWG